MPHPMQEIVLDEDGTPRFRKNSIVAFLLDAGPYNMNTLSLTPFSDEDREQFAQLIGYAVCGFGELGYASDAAVAAADETAERLKTVGSGHR